MIARKRKLVKNKLTEGISSPMTAYGFNTATGQDDAQYDAEDRLIEWNRYDGTVDQEWTLSEVGEWDTFTEEGS
jgi:YD repeat-containing protein